MVKNSKYMINSKTYLGLINSKYMAKFNLTHCIMHLHSQVSEKERNETGSLIGLVKMSGKFILIDIFTSYHFDSGVTWNKKRTC